MAYSRLRGSAMTMPGSTVESSYGGDALMAFAPEEEVSSIHVEPLPVSDPLLEFAAEEDLTSVGADPGHGSAFHHVRGL